MEENVNESQVERWRVMLEEMHSDTDWMNRMNKNHDRRKIVANEMSDFMNDYINGRIELEEFRSIYDKKTRKEWDVFGLKGMSGAMFLNQCCKNLPDGAKLDLELKYLLPCPKELSEAREKLNRFFSYLEDAAQSSAVSLKHLNPSRSIFFTSSWWHILNIESWPIYYPNTRRAFEAEDLWTPEKNIVDAYLVFRVIYNKIRTALATKSWELEWLASWHEKKPPQPPGPVGPEPPATEDDISHTQLQWLLLKIGKKIGCQVWVAANDRNKVWDDIRLGELSIKSLPSLGMDEDSQRLIGFIDVLWLKGKNQVAAAFEIEQTTSIYSGLLRMADLAAVAPNLSFPLYIVVPES